MSVAIAIVAVLSMVLAIVGLVCLAVAVRAVWRSRQGADVCADDMMHDFPTLAEPCERCGLDPRARLERRA